METQKIVNLFNSYEKDFSKFATKQWSVIDSNSNGHYSHKNQIQFLTNSIESSLCDYYDAYILVTWDIAVKNVNNAKLAAAAKVTFTTCAPFKNCRTETNDTFVDEAEYINIAMAMYNLTEYSDKYSDSSGSLWQFKKDEVVNNANATVENSSSFRCKSSFVGNTVNNGGLNGVKIAISLKYLSNFWRSLEMLLINCKVELSLTWIGNCVLATN